MDRTLDLDDVGRLPTPDDNVAVAVRRVEAGTRIAHVVRLEHLDGRADLGRQHIVRRKHGPHAALAERGLDDPVADAVTFVQHRRSSVVDAFAQG